MYVSSQSSFPQDISRYMSALRLMTCVRPPLPGLLSSEIRDQSGIQNSISQGARAISQGFPGKASRGRGWGGIGRSRFIISRFFKQEVIPHCVSVSVFCRDSAAPSVSLLLSVCVCVCVCVCVFRGAFAPANECHLKRKCIMSVATRESRPLTPSESVTGGGVGANSEECVGVRRTEKERNRGRTALSRKVRKKTDTMTQPG